MTAFRVTLHNVDAFMATINHPNFRAANRLTHEAEALRDMRAASRVMREAERLLLSMGLSEPQARGWIEAWRSGAGAGSY